MDTSRSGALYLTGHPVCLAPVLLLGACSDDNDAPPAGPAAGILDPNLDINPPAGISTIFALPLIRQLQQDPDMRLGMLSNTQDFTIADFFLDIGGPTFEAILRTTMAG